MRTPSALKAPRVHPAWRTVSASVCVSPGPGKAAQKNLCSGSRMGVSTGHHCFCRCMPLHRRCPTWWGGGQGRPAWMVGVNAKWFYLHGFDLFTPSAACTGRGRGRGAPRKTWVRDLLQHIISRYKRGWGRGLAAQSTATGGRGWGDRPPLLHWTFQQITRGAWSILGQSLCPAAGQGAGSGQEAGGELGSGPSRPQVLGRK